MNAPIEPAQTDARAPEMSVILVTPQGGVWIEKIVRCLHEQGPRDRIELVIVAPPDAVIDLSRSGGTGFHAVRVVRVPAIETTALARVAAIGVATAPVIALVEDHSFPQQGWAEALLKAHADGYAAVGPKVQNANPATLVSWANLLIEYGPWMAIQERTEMDHLPGHNCSYKRHLLQQYGDGLGAVLEAESVLHWELGKAGHRLLLDPAARVDHLNFSILSDSLVLRWRAGRAFAASRSAEWPVLRRGLFASGAPLIPAVRLLRTVRFMGKMPELRRKLALIPVIAFLLIADAIGEGAGYLFGAGRVRPRLARIELRREQHLRAEERQLAFK